MAELSRGAAGAGAAQVVQGAPGLSGLILLDPCHLATKERPDPQGETVRAQRGPARLTPSDR